MSVMRNRPKGARFAPFGLGLCIFALIPSELGYQDIASLLARQPGVAERWQKRVSSAASNIQLATYSFGRPIGTSSPQTVSYRLARLDNQGIDITGSVTRNPLVQPPPRYQVSDFPKVDRTLKGDRLATVTPEPISPAPAEAAPAPEDPSTSNASVKGAKTADAVPMPATEPARLDPELAAALSAPPLAQYDVSLSLEARPLDELKGASGTVAAVEPAPMRDHFSFKTSSLYFGSSSLGSAESMERWQPGEEPMIVLPAALPDPDLKVTASLPTPADEPSKVVESGESVAAKGEVNADNQRAKTPAERLGLLDEKSRAKSEKCLTEVIYFEARGEAVRGQIAVAQVVLNRAFSGKYPETVCGVVYQNKHRHLACQFTFACDNNADVVKEPDMWDRARKIAKAMLDGQLWLPEVAKSTHYHAYWVRPSWVSEMKKMYKFGVHTFYRPRNWGDGSEAPSWGTTAQTAEISAKLAEAAQSSAEQASARR
jgi:spore germination cell wall hydrolase CwlJ-like protein